MFNNRITRKDVVMEDEDGVYTPFIATAESTQHGTDVSFQDWQTRETVYESSANTRNHDRAISQGQHSFMLEIALA